MHTSTMLIIVPNIHLTYVVESHHAHTSDLKRGIVTNYARYDTLSQSVFPREEDGS